MPKIESHRVEGVFEDGRVTSGGAVGVNGSIIRSAPGGGCGLGDCNCSPGYWISIVKPRNSEGIVEGITYYFDNEEEMNKFLEG